MGHRNENGVLLSFIIILLIMHVIITRTKLDGSEDQKISFSVSDEKQNRETDCTRCRFQRDERKATLCMKSCKF